MPGKQCRSSTPDTGLTLHIELQCIEFEQDHALLVAVDGAYSSSITPGAVGAPFVTILLVAFLILSLREKVKGKLT